MFDVAHIDLPYNAILGFPALAKFMAVTHHAYNCLKLPGCGGTITIQGDEIAAANSLDSTYKVTAAACEAAEDEEEDSPMPPQITPASPREMGAREDARCEDTIMEIAAAGGEPPARS